MCHVHKHFINRIYMNIFRRHIFQIYIIDPRTVFHIKCHPRRCRNIRQFRLTGFSAAVYLFYFLNHFKKPGSSRNPIFFQGWRNCQADGFFRAAFIRHHQIGGQRNIKSTLHTFYGCIKWFQINCDILRHTFPLPKQTFVYALIISKSDKIATLFTFRHKHFTFL